MDEDLLNSSAFVQAMTGFRDDRKPPLDRLRTGSSLLRTMLEIKELYRREVADGMTHLLEKVAKSSRIGFESAMQHFMLVFGAISEDPQQSGTKSTDSIYRVFYQLLLLPLESKNRLQMVPGAPYSELYDIVRAERNDQLEIRYIVLLESVIKATQKFKFSEDTLVRLEGILRKASEKYESAEVLNVLVSYAVSKLCVSLEGAQRIHPNLTAWCRIVGLLILKYKAQMSQISHRLAVFLIKTNKEVLAASIMMYMLQQVWQQPEALHVCLGSIVSNQGLISQLADRVAERYLSLCEWLIEPSGLQGQSKTPKRFDVLVIQLLLSSIRNLTCSPDAFSTFTTLVRERRQADQILNRCFQEAFVASYLFEVKPFGSVPMLLDKLAYSPLSVGLLSLVYLLAKIDSIEQLRVFLVRIGLVLDPQVLREFLDELEGASQHALIVRSLESDLQCSEAGLTPYIQYFNQKTSYYQRDRLRLSLFRHYAQADKVPQLLTDYASYDLDRRTAVEASTSTIMAIQGAVIEHVFAVGAPTVQEASRFLLAISITDTHLSCLVSLLVETALATPTYLKQSRESSESEAFGLSQELFEALRMSSKRVPTPAPRQYNRRALNGLLLIDVLGPLCSSHIKKIIGLEYDRPSDHTILREFGENRLLLKLVQHGSLKTAMKSLGQLLLRTENCERQLEWLYPELTPEARVSCLRYAATKKLVGFRLQCLEDTSLCERVDPS